MTRAARKTRLRRLEDIFGAAIAATSDATRYPYRVLNGTFTGIIQDGDSQCVRIERPLTFNRDSDGSWLIYSWRDEQDDDATSITVRDPVGCDVLDALFELAANPDDFPGATFHADDDE